MPKGFSPQWEMIVSLKNKTYRHSFKRRNVDIQAVYHYIAQALNHPINDIKLGNKGSFQINNGVDQGHWFISLKSFKPF